MWPQHDSLKPSICMDSLYNLWQISLPHQQKGHPRFFWVIRQTGCEAQHDNMTSSKELHKLLHSVCLQTLCQSSLACTRIWANRAARWGRRLCSSPQVTCALLVPAYTICPIRFCTEVLCLQQRTGWADTLGLDKHLSFYKECRHPQRSACCNVKSLKYILRYSDAYEGIHYAWKLCVIACLASSVRYEPLCPV